MAIYTVHAPPDTHRLEAAERMAFVKDGFAWPALLIPIIWLLWRRLWLGLLVYVLLILAIMVLAEYVGEPVTTIVAILGSILFAWEANDFRRAKLTRRGWREVGAAAGRHLSEAESNFFHHHTLAAAEQANVHTASLPSSRLAVARATGRGFTDEPTVFGLFSEPER